MIQLRHLAMALLIALLAAACQKNQPEPATSAQKPATVAETQQRAPLILADSIVHFYDHHGTSKFNVYLQSLTASFYSNTLYLHWKQTSSSTYSSGVLPFSYSNPLAIYSALSSLTPGTYNVFLSTGTGTSYPSGSASPVYNITI